MQEAVIYAAHLVCSDTPPLVEVLKEFSCPDSPTTSLIQSNNELYVRALDGYNIGKGSLGNLAFGKGHYCYRSLLHLAPGKGSILHLALVYIIRGHCHYYTYRPLNLKICK